jgi:hypothetical protein
MSSRYDHGGVGSGGKVPFQVVVQGGESSFLSSSPIAVREPIEGVPLIQGQG